jgi:hypothetical protein
MRGMGLFSHGCQGWGVLVNGGTHSHRVAEFQHETGCLIAASSEVISLAATVI